MTEELKHLFLGILTLAISLFCFIQYRGLKQRSDENANYGEVLNPFKTVYPNWYFRQIYGFGGIVAFLVAIVLFLMAIGNKLGTFVHIVAENLLVVVFVGASLGVIAMVVYNSRRLRRKKK